MVDPVRINGNVKWFSGEKGYGFIIAQGYNRDIFVHRQQLLRSGIQELADGEQVSFVVREGNKGMYAVEVSKIIPKGK